MSLDTSIRGFVDQHGVHGHDVGSSEALHILQDLAGTGIDRTPSSNTCT